MTDAAGFDYDLFISHATEDKDSFVRPLVKRLAEAHLSAWYDETELRPGDSLIESVERGLKHSRFGVVVLSPAFFAKQWPRAELNALASRELATGERVLLPVWLGVSADDVRSASPLLADRWAIDTSRGLDYVVAQITDVVRPVASTIVRARETLGEDNATRPPSGERWLTIVVSLLSLVAAIYGLSTAPLATLSALAGFVGTVGVLHRRLWRIPPQWWFVPIPLLAAASCFGASRIVQDALRSDRIAVSLFNVDDHEVVEVNGRQVQKADYLDQRSIRLPALPTTSRIVVVATNDGAGYSWGVRLKRAGATVYCEQAGHAGFIGGGAFANDGTVGQVRRLVFSGQGKLLHAWHVSVPGFSDDRGVLTC